MKLVWDSDQFVIAINQLSIHIAPEQCPPFDVVAKIEEQDTSLILEPGDTINEYNDDKPVWYLSNTQALQETHQTGNVIIKHGQPLRLLAIIHDLDNSPSWREDWIKLALETSFSILNDREITSVALPCFGRHFKNFETQDFIRPLAYVIQKSNYPYPRKIWLIVPIEQCQAVHHLMKQILSRQR